VLRTDRQLIIIRVGELRDLLRATIAKPHCQCFAIGDVCSATELRGRDFDIQLAGETKVTVRNRPWPDKKFAEAFRDELVAVAGSGPRDRSPAP
jgi:hypothetical protein